MSNISYEDDIDYNNILLIRLILWGYIGIILSIFSIIANIFTIIILLSSSMRIISTNILQYHFQIYFFLFYLFYHIH